MSLTPEESIHRQPTARELSPNAQRCSMWFRSLARAVKTGRLYRSGDNEVVEGMRQQLWEELTEQLRSSGGWQLQVRADAIALDDEVVVRGSVRKPGVESSLLGAPEEKLPFMFYGDGIRGISFGEQLSRREFDAFFDAMVTAGRGRNSQDDLTTLLWQSNLGGLHVEMVPLEQAIYLSTRRPQRARGGGRGQTFAWAAAGSEIRSDLGQMAGAQGLHRDTFDDWLLPDVHAHPPQAYAAIAPDVEASRARLLEALERENATPWIESAPALIRLIARLSPDADTRWAFCHSVATWLGAAIQEGDWAQAETALQLIQELDPRRVFAPRAMAERLDALEFEPIAERLDDDEAGDQGRFVGFSVHVGRPAIPMLSELLGLCTRQRARAACVTALSYLAAEDPRVLQPLLDDPRWFVVRNAVFVLGQIGGTPVVDLLRSVALHREPRVRREVVRALASVSRAERTPILILQLRAKDAQLVSLALQLLTRERNPRVNREILERVEDPGFEQLPADLQRAFLTALLEVADESMIPAFELLLRRNDGWFSMRTLVRDSAARLLRRIGSERAMRILEDGLRSKSEAVRLACLDALSEGRSAA